MTERDIKARLRDAANAHGLVSADLIRGIFRDSLARVEALEAERDRLREALKEVLEWADPYALPNCDRNERSVQRALAALAPPAAPAEETGQAPLCNCCERPLGDATTECPHCHVKFAVGPPAAEGARPIERCERCEGTGWYPPIPPTPSARLDERDIKARLREQERLATEYGFHEDAALYHDALALIEALEAENAELKGAGWRAVVVKEWADRVEALEAERDANATYMREIEAHADTLKAEIAGLREALLTALGAPAEEGETK